MFIIHQLGQTTVLEKKRVTLKKEKSLFNRKYFGIKKMKLFFFR